MCWNCPAVSSLGFLKTFKSLRNMYQHTLVALLEPRVIGMKANVFIQMSGYDNSHQVKVVGFARGIWLLWNDKISVEIIVITGSSSTVKFPIVRKCCYGSPLFMLAHIHPFEALYGRKLTC